jgi:hypothetical protein
MTSTIRNSAVLRAVRPQDVAVYLQARRWREQERREGEYAIWQRTADDEPVEILLPLNTAYRDYAARIAGVLQTLEAIEQRSQLDILADIQTVGCDAIHISAEGEALAGRRDFAPRRDAVYRRCAESYAGGGVQRCAAASGLL